MSSGAGFPGISKQELFGRFARGHVARLTVVTPNLRLAAALARNFDSLQFAGGLAAWETADILPLPAFIERLYADALYSELAPRLPALLTPAQEQAVWEGIVRSSEAGKSLLSVPSAAALAREAWQLSHAWRLTDRLKAYPANDDARAYADWAWRYDGATKRDRQCDRAGLADIVAPHLGHAALHRPAALVAYGFDMLTPQQREFLRAIAAAGTELLESGPEERGATVRRVAFNSAREEIRAAARWARSRLAADPGARIGIVVPDLAQTRNALRRAFAQVMVPGHALPGGGAGLLPFNISLGQPLSSYPLVAAAMLVLDIARGEVEFSHASRLLRSPFLAGAEKELAQRAGLDAELRRVCGARTGLERLRRAIARLAESGRGAGACSILAHRLAGLSRMAKEQLHGAKRPGEWGRVFSALLEAVGFPGERTLDSAEYQTLKKFHETIAGFAALDRVAGRMRPEDACTRLARIAADTLFQPEAPEVPIQVLGVLESAGIEFDHLWVMGLTDEVWPIAARPNPFIPVALQRAAGVPEASAAASLELDRRITHGWLAAAGEVVLSHPLREEDRELVPSPLIRELPESKPEDLALPECQMLRDVIHRARREQRIGDARGPSLRAGDTSAGGTSVFMNQAACPFRAFALHRLRAEGLVFPSAGLDARERGTLAHAMLAHLWQALKSKARLDNADAAELDALLAQGADHALGRLRRFRPDAIEGRYAELEQARLVKLGRAWLEVERGRAPFAVVAVEHKRPVSFGGVAVYAKLDRLDRLIGGGGERQGGHAVIDYKTGAASVGDWLGARPDDPQLPLYAVSVTEDVSAVAFAQLKTGGMEFKGIAREEDLIPGVKTLAGQRLQGARDYASWEELLAGWRYELEALGKEFAVGEARVDPKRGDDTCRWCELKPLCRINERARGLGAEADGDGA